MSLYALWGPPRSGKTTLALDLACAYNRRDKSVCLIAPEAYCVLSARLGIHIPQEHSLSAALRRSGGIRQSVLRLDDLLCVLAVPDDYDALDETVSSNQARELLDEARVTYDTVLVDCPSHTGSVIAAWALNKADKVLLLSGGQAAASLWHAAYHRATAALQSRAVPVCAEVTEDFDYTALYKLMVTLPIVRLPHCPRAAALEGGKRFLYRAGSKRGRTYAEAVDRLLAQLEVEAP